MISLKRIRNINRYLSGIEQGDMFYIIKYTTQADGKALETYGLEPSIKVVPRPKKGATIRNAEGYWIVYKDRLKEPRQIYRDYHIVDWHGNDHYGICCQTRQCYPREHVAPACCELSIYSDCVMSQLLSNTPDQTEKNTLIMNIFLEIFGECEVVTKEKEHPLAKQVIQRVPWEILPPGKLPWERGEQGIRQILTNVPKSRQLIISQRHTTIHTFIPDFCAIGRDGFWGYLVYRFSALNIFVFESTQYDNATYIFRGAWEEASKLTKQEILIGHLHKCRLYHTDKWADNLKHQIR